MVGNEIISLVELDPSNPPNPLFQGGEIRVGSIHCIDRVGFAIVFGRKFFEPTIFKWSEYFHRDDFFWFDEEIIVVRFARDSLMICPRDDRFISGETIISIATISCDSIDIE